MKKQTDDNTTTQAPQVTDENLIKIAELEQKLADSDAKMKSALADYQNIVKEVEKQRSFLADIVKKAVFSDLIELFTDLYMSIDQLPADLKDDTHISGVVLIINKYKDLLAKHGVTEITFAEGENYDPSKAEVVGFLESEEYKGKVAQTVQPGYVINDVIIKPARVLIYKNN